MYLTVGISLEKKENKLCNRQHAVDSTQQDGGKPLIKWKNLSVLLRVFYDINNELFENL